MSCSAIGTPPIYIEMIRNATTMVNAIGTATIVISEEGIYNCWASNRYGIDQEEVSIIFTVNNTYTTFLILRQLC